MSQVDKIGSTWSHLCAACHMAGVSLSLTQTHHWSFSVSHRKHIVFSCLSQLQAPLTAQGDSCFVKSPEGALPQGPGPLPATVCELHISGHPLMSLPFLGLRSMWFSHCPCSRAHSFWRESELAGMCAPISQGTEHSPSPHGP